MKPNFSPERLQAIARMERWHFWFSGRRALVESWIDQYLAGTADQVIDLGCGTGAMLERLDEKGFRVAGTDALAEGLNRVRLTSPQTLLVQSDVVNIPLAAESFDAALLLDVLEHVDDHAALRETYRILRSNGHVIITVPAFEWLRSYRDEAVGHLRRYQLRDLVALINGAGFEVREIRYYQCLLLPLVIMTRWFGRRNQQWRDIEDLPLQPINRLFTWINLLEVRLNTVISWPCGSSLAAVCRKKM